MRNPSLNLFQKKSQEKKKKKKSSLVIDIGFIHIADRSRNSACYADESLINRRASVGEIYPGLWLSAGMARV